MPGLVPCDISLKISQMFGKPLKAVKISAQDKGDGYNKAAMTLMFRMIVHNPFMGIEMLNRSKL